MTINSIRILCRLDFPSQTVRLWDGSGPYMDADGEVWSGAGSVLGLDSIEHALNGEASTLQLTLAASTPELTDLAWAETNAGDVVGSIIQIMIQPCDTYDQPVGPPEARFTGTIDDINFDEVAQGDGTIANVTIDCANRFNLRNLTNGAVLSDVDQRARSALLNPSGNPDRIAERVPSLLDKTISWPKYSG